ncbi:hypothetical protein O6H91_07G008700 [Diphasiastrum complanatum]|uniref:Uncharacterized protein n=1 Tax=Diphasiastrum complanatum TaxID=34168 RepID=A0ACC2D263_DIPCM|nr:hypothetical protein O6H91_07G008700 [Diphasiastrum complanatum]
MCMESNSGFAASVDIKQSQLQVEDGAKNLPPMEPLPIIDNNCGMNVSSAEENFNGIKCALGESPCVLDTFVPRAKSQLRTPDCRQSGRSPPNKTQGVLLAKGQTESRPLQELLHLKEEPFLLWELLQIKEETTPSCTDKVSEFLKKPLDVVQKKQRKFIPVVERLKKPLMQEIPSRLPKAHALVSDVQRENIDLARYAQPFAMSPECTYASALSIVSHIKRKSTPSNPLRSPKKSVCKKPLMLLEVACKVLEPGKQAYCHSCLPLVQPFSGKYLCLRDTTDHNKLATNAKPIRANFLDGSMIVSQQVHVPHHSSEEHCNRRGDGMKQSESNGFSKRGPCDVVRNKVDKELLKSDDLGWNNDDYHLFQSEQASSENAHEIQNHASGEIGLSCEGVLRRARSLRERISPAAATKSFLLRSYSLKEGVLPSRFFCFSPEFVRDQLSDSRTTRKPQKFLSAKYTPSIKEDRLPQKNKVYPSDDTEGSFLFIQPDRSIKVTRELNNDANTDSKIDIVASRQSLDLKGNLPAVMTNAPPDLPSTTDCNGRVTTLRDMLSVNIDEEDLPVLGRENMSETCQQVCHLDLRLLESRSTCDSTSFASDMANELQVVHQSDHGETEYEEVLSPNLQKKVFFDGMTSFHGVEGSEPIPECKLLEENGQPSPVSILDSRFIDEIPSPDKAEIFSDQPVNQLTDDYHFSKCQPVLEIATVETSIGRYDDTSNSWENEYVLLEKVVDALLHSSMMEDTKKPWSEDNRWCTQDAYLPEYHSGKRDSLQYHFSNFDLLEEEKCQKSRLRGDNILQPKATSGYECSLLKGRRMLEELTENQMLVDCVTEALEILDLRESCYTFGNSSFLGMHRYISFREKFVYEVYRIICSWSGRTAATTDDLVVEDIYFSSRKWININSELLEIASEIECILFDILINDAVVDVLDLELKI